MFNFNLSSLFKPTPLSSAIGNVLMASVNTANRVLDAVAPIGLVANQIFGSAYTSVHKAGDTFIANISDSLAKTATSLGATLTEAPTHYTNEWTSNAATNYLKNPLSTNLAKAIPDSVTNLVNLSTSLLAPINTVLANPSAAVNAITPAVNDLVSSTIYSINSLVKIGIGAVSAITVIAPALPKIINNTVSSLFNPSKTVDPAVWVNSAVAGHAAPTTVIEGQKSYKLSQPLMDKIQAFYKTAVAADSGKVGLWADVYRMIEAELQSETGVDQGTLNWLHIAKQVNAGVPGNFVYEYIFTSTRIALAEQGINVTRETFTKASNQLVRDLVEHLINGIPNTDGKTVVPSGYLPTSSGLYGLVAVDAGGVFKNLNGSLSDWAGVTPFSLIDPYLHVDTSIYNYGSGRNAGWYLTTVGEALVTAVNNGMDLVTLGKTFALEISKILGGYLSLEFTPNDQMINSLVQIAYTFANPLAPVTSILTNLLNPNVHLQLGTLLNDALNGTAGNDIITAGAGNDTVKGGDGNDVIFGELGDDKLDGGKGFDILMGGAGNDTYYINDNQDAVMEIPNAGADTVVASVNFKLPSNVENLTLTGTTAINGIGNELANIITGNDGDNILSGLAGNDTLLGGKGKDILVGGIGNDILNGGEGSDLYIFEAGFGKDIIRDKEAAANNDIILFDKAIDKSQVYVTYNNLNLEVHLKNDANNVITIENWKSGVENQVELFAFNKDSSVISSAQINQLLAQQTMVYLG